MGESRPYGCPSGSQNELIVGAGRGMCPNPARVSDRQRKGFEPCLPRSRWRKRGRHGE